MIIYTANGPKQFLPVKHQDSPAALRLDRIWRDAWNDRATKYNHLIAFTQERYERMLDVAPLRRIPADSFCVPGIDYRTKD